MSRRRRAPGPSQRAERVEHGGNRPYVPVGLGLEPEVGGRIVLARRRLGEPDSFRYPARLPDLVWQNGGDGQRQRRDRRKAGIQGVRRSAIARRRSDPAVICHGSHPSRQSQGCAAI